MPGMRDAKDLVENYKFFDEFEEKDMVAYNDEFVREESSDSPKYKKQYTYKEILLAFREELLKNKILLDELKKLTTIEKNAGTYYFMDYLKYDYEPYKVRLIINELEKRQSKLRSFLDKLTNYQFARGTNYKCQNFNVLNEKGKIDFDLVYSTGFGMDNFLGLGYFGEIKIEDSVKFNEILNNLNNSKIAKIKNDGIHTNNGLFLGISSYVEFLNGRNIMHYNVGTDSLKIDLLDKSFEKMMNTPIDTSLLSNEVLDIIEGSSYKDYDIRFEDDKKSKDHYYKFNEHGKSIVLTCK